MTLATSLLIHAHHPNRLAPTNWQDQLSSTSLTVLNQISGSSSFSFAFKNQWIAQGTGSYLTITGGANNAQHSYTTATQQLGCRFPFTDGLKTISGSTNGGSLIGVDSTLIMTAGGGVMRQYRNGFADGTVVFSGTVPNTSWTSCLYGYTTVKVADFMVWNREITPTEVAELHTFLMQSDRFTESSGGNVLESLNRGMQMGRRGA